MANADRVVAPLILFIGVYVATLFALALATPAAGQWIGLASVAVATAVAVGAIERGRWPLGLFVRPVLILREMLLGLAFGTVLVGGCAVLVALSTPVTHGDGAGFPWSELLLVLIPAVLHEELLFRGYAFQKLLRWRRWPALSGVALVFALLHAGNPAASPLGLLNVLLGGLLLGVAYEVYARLWLPIGFHGAWNVMVGPITGHEVSGYVMQPTVLTVRGEGPAWLTGGDFGLEGSIFMTLCEVIALAVLLEIRRRRAAVTASVAPDVGVRAENAVREHS
ncbi:MAG: type II CAAX endopeptidase family protein [Thermoanaerobaculia bacterium]